MPDRKINYAAMKIEKGQNVKPLIHLLKEVRKTKGIPQEFFRFEFGTDISNLENYRNCPSLDKFFMYCEGLQISPGWLLILTLDETQSFLGENDKIRILSNWISLKNEAEFAYQRFLSTIEGRF
jgi:transcriptional regulator with XRE-family HTH domain